MRISTSIICLLLFCNNFFAQQTKIDSLENIIKTSKEDTSMIYAYQDLCILLEYTNPQKALEYIENAIELGESTIDYRSLSNSYLFRGYLAEDLGKYNLAKQFYQKALKASNKSNFKHAKGRVYNSIGEVNRMQGNYDTALYYYQLSMDIKKDMNNLNGIAASLNNISIVYEQQGDYHKAINKQQEAIRINKELNDLEEVARNLGNIGIIYFSMGDYENALEYYFQSAAIVEKMQDKSAIGSAYNNIGLLLNMMGNQDKALEYYNRALLIYKELNYKRETAVLLDNIGVIKLNNKDFQEAANYFDQSYSLGVEMNNKSSMSRSLMNIGNVYYQQYQFSKALEYYKKSYKILKQIGEKVGIANILINIGSAYIETGILKEAIKYNQKGLDIAKEIGAKETIKLAYSNFHSIYSKLGKYQEAYKYHILYSEVKDSLLNESTSKQINELEARYESDRKEKEILLLNKDKQLKELEIKKKTEIAKRQKVIIYSVIAGFIIILIFSIFLYKLYSQKKKANILLDKQKTVIEQKNKDITDSINYAKRIQEAILTSSDYCHKILPQHFILFKPKDIVSGDFYWAYATHNNNAIWTVADCTGHGVPGAFMSMIGSSLLNEIVIEKGITTANVILDELKKSIIKALGQTGAENETKDGMDAALCIWHKDTNKLEFAGANNSLYIIRKNIANSEIAKNEKVKFFGTDLAEYKADKQPIGFHVRKDAPFTQQEIQLQKGDAVYMFSDGYADQFGGEKEKKFTYKRFKKLLLNINEKTMQEQKEILDETLEEWKEKLEQIDDICIVGVRI